MVKRTFRLSIAAWVLCLLPLFGCETKRVWVQLEGVDEGNVEGIWLWRLSDELGSYERVCRIPFGDHEIVGATESVHYIQECGDDGQDGIGFELSTELKRSTPAQTRVTLGLWYLRWEDPGVYKVSSYGAYGETALSLSTIQL